MDMDKIIGAMRAKRNNKIIEAQDFSRCGYSKREMLVLADGYSMAVKDLSDLIAQQTPPCTGSSVHKQSKIDKLKHDFKKVTEPSTVTTIDGKGNVTLEFNKMTESYHKTPPTNEQLMDKINEIIDVINGER